MKGNVKGNNNNLDPPHCGVYARCIATELHLSTKSDMETDAPGWPDLYFGPQCEAPRYVCWLMFIPLSTFVHDMV